MKKLHIIGLVVIAVAIGMIISTVGDASQYVTFDKAFKMAENGDDDKIHVVGQLKKDAQGNILGMQYNPQKDPNYFTFILVDQNQQEQTVVYHSPKPADFERSEQVVVVGNVQNNHFIASKILMKCPSKYQEGEMEIKEVEAKPTS